MGDGIVNNHKVDFWLALALWHAIFGDLVTVGHATSDNFV